MCGIVGLSPVNKLDYIKQMNDQIIHRGPDDEGLYHDLQTDTVIAMRRLSIIDLEHGHQPLSNEDQSIWVVCNGEIYNSPELRTRLLAKGHKFRTENSDVEVLVHLYEEYGRDLLLELNGMYAFVILDLNQKQLFGARDRIGIKPLYYHFEEGRFAFASELKSLLKLDFIKKELNIQAISDFLSFQFIPAPQSPFKSVKKLAAGCCFSYDLQEKDLSITEYWKLKVEPIQASRKELLDETRNQLRAAVDRWTLSDVPIGVSLSGGLDSSALVGLLAESGHQQLKTFSIGFSDASLKKYDELDLAKLVAEKYHSEHLEFQLDSNAVLSDLQKMVYHLDEPYGGGLPSWYVYSSMSKHVKVGMTGTGGDELFGNYGKAFKYQHLKAHKLRRAAKALIKNRSVNGALSVFKYPNASASWMFFQDHHKKDLLFKGLHKAESLLASERYIEDIWAGASTLDPRDLIPQLDFPMQLAEEFLQVTDRFSMAHSIEARVPFLDHQLVEFVMSIPSEYRVPQNRPKQFLLDAVSDLLPEKLINAKKRGFVLPLKEWTRGELRSMVEELLSEKRLTEDGIFNPGLYKNIVVPHLNAQQNNTEKIWTLLMFQLWKDEFYS